MNASFWNGKRVLITGASSGLGYSLVEALAPFRVHFCLLSRREEPMRELASRFSESGRFWIRSCDVRNRTEVDSAVDAFVHEAGGIDVAWINSGVSTETSFRRWDWQDAEAILDTNLKGAIYTTQACLRHMVPQNHGVIAGISSSAAMRGLPGRALYSATKVAFAFYLESLACELPRIQFTTIYPGFVDTPINRNNPNRFWLLSPEKAVKLMIRAVEKGKSESIFPFRMKLLFHFIRILPAALYRRLGRRLLELSRPR